MNRIIIAIILLSAHHFCLGSEIYYVSNNGKEFTTCKTGPDNEWNSLKTLKDKCLKPGDTLVFTPGTYKSDFLLNGKLGINKDFQSQIPIYIKSQQSNEDWPVKFYSNGFDITTGGPLSISGIEFIKPSTDKSKKAIIAIGISKVSLNNNYIHGEKPQLELILNNSKNRIFDCIYAPSTALDVTDIEIKNNIISNCSQDAIDLPGSKNVNIIGNDISNSLEIQIKGGAENINISNNVIHSMVYGIVGGTMKCPYYCGSPSIPKTPPKDRYNAKNIVIDNNIFYNIEKNWIVNFTGWKDAHIINNTINQNLISNKQEIFSSNNWHTQYYDQKAAAYCKANKSDCYKCAVPPKQKKQNCVSIYMPPKNISIKNNNIEISNQLFLKLFNKNHNEENEICIDSDNKVNKKAMRLYEKDGIIKELYLAQSPECP